MTLVQNLGHGKKTDFVGSARRGLDAEGTLLAARKLGPGKSSSNLLDGQDGGRRQNALRTLTLKTSVTRMSSPAEGWLDPGARREVGAAGRKLITSRLRETSGNGTVEYVLDGGIMTPSAGDPRGSRPRQDHVRHPGGILGGGPREAARRAGRWQIALAQKGRGRCFSSPRRVWHDVINRTHPPGSSWSSLLETQAWNELSC